MAINPNWYQSQIPAVQQQNTNTAVTTSKQNEQTQLKQQLQKPAPSVKQSFLKSLLTPNHNRLAGIEHAVGSAAKAVIRPVTDMATLKSPGQVLHDTSQLSSDVTGGLLNQFAKAAVATPVAIKREIQNKPITDIQKKTFGTTKPTDIAKKIVASTVGTGSLLVGGGEAGAAAKAGSKVIKPAIKLGTAGAAGNTAATELNNPNATKKQLAESAGIGFGLGAGGTVAAKGTSKLVGMLGKADKNIPVETKFTPTETPKIETPNAEKTTIQPTNESSTIPETVKPPASKSIAPEQSLLEHAQSFKTYKGFVSNDKTHDLISKLPPEAKADSKGLQEIYKHSQEPRYVPLGQPTDATPKIKTSKLAQGVESKAIESNLTKGFEGKPEYAQVNVKDQAKAAINLLNTDPERALRIAHGKEHPPEGLLPESVFTAVENHATNTKNVDLLRSLATESSLPSEATGMGQRIRLLAERDPDSAVAGIKKVIDARKTATEAKLKTSSSSAVQTTVKDIRANTPKVTKQTWSEFVEGLKC